ncbi:MAG: hypothetical protein ACHQIM_00255 [Sphingobacteriales bacterium]
MPTNLINITGILSRPIRNNDAFFVQMPVWVKPVLTKIKHLNQRCNKPEIITGNRENVATSSE